MEVYIILALVLALLQIWIIPLVLNLSNLEWMLSNREEVLDDSPMLIRSRKAYANLQETLPIFLVLAVLSIQLEVANEQLAEGWLITRLIYLVLGIANVYSYPFIRTGVWFVSIGFMVCMACNLMSA